MALIFGVFHRAPDDIQDALIEFVSSASEAKRRSAAMLIVDRAAMLAPDFSIRDLSKVVRQLLKEAERGNWIKDGTNTLHMSQHFLSVISPKNGPNGLPCGADEDLTLAELVVSQTVPQTPEKSGSENDRTADL